MKKATFSDIRNNAKKYFDSVEKGEPIEVYRHGKPIARITPIVSEVNLDKFKSWQPLVLSNKKLSLSNAVIEDRRKRG